MAIKRVVNTEFWTDGKVVDMFSPEDKLFMLYLLTNPHASLLGIYPLTVRVAAFEIGFSVDTVKVLIDRFQSNYRIILYSEKTQEVAILNWLRHAVIKGGKPVMDCLEAEARRVKDKSLLARVLKGLEGEENLIPTVSDFVNKYKGQYSTNNVVTTNMDMVMGMDMDMELRGRNVDETSADETPEKIKSIRHKYGSYKNVLLTDEDLEKLKAEFPSDLEIRIERLSEYMASTGKKYKNHLATIRSWARKDKEKQPKDSKESKESAYYGYGQRLDDLDHLF